MPQGELKERCEQSIWPICPWCGEEYRDWSLKPDSPFLNADPGEDVAVTCSKGHRYRSTFHLTTTFSSAPWRGWDDEDTEE